MQSLFPLEPHGPEGFQYVPDFISASEEQQLYEVITQTTLHNFQFQGYEAKRKVASFGYDWNFEKQMVVKGNDIPQAFEWLIERIAAHLSLPAQAFKELLVTGYPVDAVINWHRDAPPFDIIAGVSLMADCIFRLRPHEKAKQNRRSVISLTAKRRSLYILQGVARTGWQHSIAPVKEVRYSITLRTLRH